MSSVATAPPAVWVSREIALPAFARRDLAYTVPVVVGPLSAGLVTLHTVPGGVIEILQQVTFTWTTSNVVANRSLGVKFLDVAGDVVGQTLVNGTQPASTSYRYTFMLDAGGSFVAGTFGLAQLPFLFSQPGEQWQLIGTALDPGDVQNGLTYTVIRIPTGPGEAPVEATVVPTPALS